jgi:hypothetical protein
MFQPIASLRLAINKAFVFPLNYIQKYYHLLKVPKLSIRWNTLNNPHEIFLLKLSLKGIGTYFKSFSVYKS